MKPVMFSESNLTLNAPKERQDIHKLPAWSDGKQIISKWKLSFWERVRVLFHGNIWLRVLSDTHPAVSMEPMKTVFEMVKTNVNAKTTGHRGILDRFGIEIH